MKRYIPIPLLAITALLCLWPDFHPEERVLERYYWQADVLIHAGYYFGLCLLLLLLRPVVRPGLVCLGLALFSLILEALQHYSHLRAASLMDMASNLAGISLAWGSYSLWKRQTTTLPATEIRD